MLSYQFFFLLEELKKQSKCLDKQVACIITDDTDRILSVGINEVQVCSNCTKKGGDQKGCSVTHAEIAAVANLNDYYLSNGYELKAYVSLYPCEKCQLALKDIVSEVIVFGTQHKAKINDLSIKMLPNLSLALPEMNGEQKQLAVVQGEQAELITAISDYFYREDERGDGLDSLLKEIVDSKLQTSVLIAILQNKYSSSVYHDLGQIEQKKLMKIKDALESGRILRGSPYDKTIQDK